MMQHEAAAAVDRINAALVALPSPTAAFLPCGTMLLVCRATRSEWNAFVQSEDARMNARFLVWIGPETITNGHDAGEIHIVEYPVSLTHELVVFALDRTIFSDAATMRCLTVHGAASNTCGPRLRPDMSYGPKESVMRSLGATLPANVPNWSEFVTIKIEIGVSQTWGETPGRLDWKAFQWATVPGVVYVLCIHVERDLQAASYKLYEVLATGQPPPYQAIATAIVGPATNVQLGARRVLGVGPNDTVPVGFPNPFVVDLFAVLAAARAQL